ncbi:MAG: thioredoxin family protein [Betaproteobacteria bacterium]|nr:thioredoxin family protein [Betaproteobacteria bacterium]
MTRLSMRIIVLLASLFLSTAVLAGESKPYDKASFERLRATGAPVLVEVHADWCITCRLQAPVITELLRQPPFQIFHKLTVNFDTQRDALRDLKVSTQSTLIVFRNGREVARSVADTDKAAIAALLRTAL